MSYGKQNMFSVTTGRDGSRSFRDDGHWHGNSNNASQRGQRGGRGGQNRRSRPFRHYNADSSRFRTRHVPGQEDADGDVSMSGNRNNRGRSFHDFNHGRGINNRRGPRSRPGPSGGSYHQKKESWFKVMIPFGASLSQEELYALINSEISGPFEPINYSKDEKRAYFFIKGNPMADSLRSISRRITKQDGHKLIIHVSPSQTPLEHTIDENTVEKLKFRMSERYDPATQVLNLSALCMDDVLQKEKVYLPLNRAATMAAVTKIIGEHIPELSGLDVSKNKILSVGHMSDLVKAAPNVVSLNLGNNQIRTLDELDKLKGWANLTELVLDGNDLCNSFTNESAYISAVRKKFPKVVKLDGKDLPPPITFDLENIVTLPPTKGSYFVHDDVQNLVVLFIKEYYSIYDSDRRRELMPAYHENAQFSIYSVKNPLTERQVGFTSYFDESRNLKKIGHIDSDKLAKKIKTGVLSVVSCLETLPKTTHDPNTFIVDVILATPTMLSFVLQGIFKENDNRSDRPTIRSFVRTIVTVPSGPGMVIINDMLTISNASLEQAKNAFKAAAPTPSSSPVSSSQVAGPSTSCSSTPVPLLTPLHMEWVESFSTESGMNAQFSLKCLLENGWDYQQAAQKFTELNSQGRIPPEAFAKTDH